MTKDMLFKMSRLASDDPFYMGWHLARYSKMKGLSISEMGKELGCLPETVTSISLCRAPRSEPPHFRNDIERVANRFQVRADKLVGIIRYVQVASDESMLLAARDRDTKEDKDTQFDE